MAYLVIRVHYDSEPHYQEAEVAAALLRFIARITSWGTLPLAGVPITITDHRGRCIGVAQTEE